MNNCVHRLSIAPMMDWTDRHCRYFHRLVTQKSLLYTEMVTAQAIMHGNRAYLLDFHSTEHPIALQLGGSDPVLLAQAAKYGEQWGYDEINLNVGCPSERVQNGQFGACLMLQPRLVRDCIDRMQSAVNVPVTVKCRIGIDKEISYTFLKKFVEIVRDGGCTTFIIHARNAWLQGLSPKENRMIPPLRYDLVYKLKNDFPELCIVINGGIKTYSELDKHLQYVDGAMIGREAYHNPYFLSEFDQRYYHAQQPIPTRLEIIRNLLPYMNEQCEQNVYLKHITRHILGLYQGQKGAKKWRQILSNGMFSQDMVLLKESISEFLG
jgi:tRNA-dihydrouridine synthase A